jgi:hypothetical protein
MSWLTGNDVGDNYASASGAGGKCTLGFAGEPHKIEVYNRDSNGAGIPMAASGQPPSATGDPRIIGGTINVCSDVACSDVLWTETFKCVDGSTSCFNDYTAVHNTPLEFKWTVAASYPPGPVDFVKNANKACSGRNEVFTGSVGGDTVETCKAHCLADDACISFEFHNEKHGAAGLCQCSSSCDSEVMADYVNIDLYILGSPSGRRLAEASSSVAAAEFGCATEYPGQCRSIGAEQYLGNVGGGIEVCQQ